MRNIVTVLAIALCFISFESCSSSPTDVQQSSRAPGGTGRGDGTGDSTGGVMGTTGASSGSSKEAGTAAGLNTTNQQHQPERNRER
jgi:hypothetical protein